MTFNQRRMIAISKKRRQDVFKIIMTDNVWKQFFVKMFGFTFIVLVLIYTFLDDGGIESKTFFDFVTIPFVSFTISLIITSIVSMIAFVVAKFLLLFQGKKEIEIDN